MRQNEPSAVLVALPVIFVLIIVTIVLVAVLLLTDVLAVSGVVPFPTPTPRARPTPARAVMTPAALGMAVFRSTALGFELGYPSNWRKKETTLAVTLTPSVEGFDLDHYQDGVIRVGIPAGEILDHGDILRGLLGDFPPPIEVLDQETRDLASASWTTVQFSFGDPGAGTQGFGLAAATNKNEVGYFIVAAAPATQWHALQPTFQQVVDSFRFTEEAVLRPTDATPPPTPTPTPTPVIYIVQSGDTLLGIALEFGVDVDILAARNGIEVPEHLRTGQRLIIPVRRR
jgi:LysM repeat protein